MPASVMPSDAASSSTAPHPWDYVERPLPLHKKIIVAIAGPLVLLPLALVRLLLVMVLAILLVLVCALFGRWRCIIVPLVAVLGRLFLFCFGVWPGMLSFHKPAKQEKAPVVALAPHVGGLEAFVMMYDGMPRAIAMETYANLPVVSSIFHASGGIAVPMPAANDDFKRERQLAKAKVAPEPDGDVEAPKAAEKPATQAVRQAIGAYKKNFDPSDPSLSIPLCILPEGTTHNGRSLLKFFSGAFEGGGPVQPVLLSYPHTHFNASFFGRGLGDHALRLLFNPWQFITVKYLDVYHPTEQEAADAERYAENVRRAMAEAASVPCSDYGAKALRAEFKAAQAARKQ